MYRIDYRIHNENGVKKIIPMIIDNKNPSMIYFEEININKILHIDTKRFKLKKIYKKDISIENSNTSHAKTFNPKKFLDNISNDFLCVISLKDLNKVINK